MTRPRRGTLLYALLQVLVSTAIAVGQERSRLHLDAQALLDAGLFERAEAAARVAVENSRVSSADENLELATASDVLVRALVLNGRAANADTLALAQRTLRIKETTLGSGHAALVPSLLNLGDVLIAAVDFEQAIAVAQRATALRQRDRGPVSLDTAEALDHLGRALAAAGRYDDALKVLERSLRLKEEVLDGMDVGIARTLEDLGLAFQRKGDYDRSGAALRRAAALQEASSINHPAYARTLNLVAQQRWFEGQLVESKEASERAVDVAERTLRPDHPTVALSLRYLAGTLADLGDLTRSLELKERALGIAERNFGASHAVTAEYRYGLGLIELETGAYANARLHIRRALSAFEARYGPWHEYVATARSVLALADARLGDYANAHREQARAVAIHSRVGGPNHPFVAIAITELAAVLNEQGLPSQALPLLQRALVIREKTLGPDHRDVARTLADLASTLMQTGQPARAQQLATRALRIWERLDTPDAPEFATVLAFYAGLQARRGDNVAARDYYSRALAIRAKVFGASNPSYAEAQAGLASALATLGDRANGLNAAAMAETTGRDHLRLMLRSLPERQALLYAAARPRGLSLILSLAAAADAIPVGLDALIRSRALVLDEIAARRSAAHAVGDGSDPARVALASAQQRLANLQVRGPGPMTPTQYSTVVDDARREGEIAEQTLAAANAEFRAERTRARIGMDEVKAALPPDTALVSFARYDRTILTGSPPGSVPKPSTRASPAVPSYLAFVLRTGRPAAVVPIGSARVIDVLVSKWRADIAAEALPRPATPQAEAPSSRQSGAVLRRQVWDGLAEHLAGTTTVFIVPDGALSLVPFAALPVGRRSYLIDDGPVIHYLSAERDLVLPPPSATPSRGLLAVGGPSFDDRSVLAARTRTTAPFKPTLGVSQRGAGQTCAGLQSVVFQALGGTLREVQDVSGIWNATDRLEPEPARVLVGRGASEAAFKRDAPGHRVLHVATHGFFLNGACDSAPGTRGVGGLSSTTATARSVENPLRLSGLALAGANRRASAGPNEDDGILTAEEVASLNLEGVEWAVLSACDTGVGEIKAGEGVFGLRRAFQVAGARTVVMSLWSVDDQATRAWMRALYEGRFQRKLSTADAVHAASLSLLRERRAKGQSAHPFYWAAFVAAGDWR